MTVLHDDEIPIDLDLARKLIHSEFTQYADLPLHRLEASGSTNALFRLGEDLLFRLPRQPGKRCRDRTGSTADRSDIMDIRR